MVTAPGYVGKTAVIKKTLTPEWNLFWTEQLESDKPYKAHIEIRDHNGIQKRKENKRNQTEKMELRATCIKKTLSPEWNLFWICLTTLQSSY